MAREISLLPFGSKNWITIEMCIQNSLLQLEVTCNDGAKRCNLEQPIFRCSELCCIVCSRVHRNNRRRTMHLMQHCENMLICAVFENCAARPGFADCSGKPIVTCRAWFLLNVATGTFCFLSLQPRGKKSISNRSVYFVGGLHRRSQPNACQAITDCSRHCVL